MPSVPRVSSAAAEHQAPWQATAAGSDESAALIPARPNEVWSADFMSDALWSGRRFRTFNVMDDFNREALRDRDRHEPSGIAGRASARPAHRDPRQAGGAAGSTTARSSSATSRPSGLRRHGVKLRFIQPGRPMQNGFIERFNRTYRQEVLNCYVFETLGEVRRMTADWISGVTTRTPARVARQPLPAPILDGKINLTLYF